MGNSVVNIKTSFEGFEIKVAFLTRQDLKLWYQDLPIEEITVYNFSSRSLTEDDINKCHNIIFRDEEQIKELKKRF